MSARNVDMDASPSSVKFTIRETKTIFNQSERYDFFSPF